MIHSFPGQDFFSAIFVILTAAKVPLIFSLSSDSKAMTTHSQSLSNVQQDIKRWNLKGLKRI